MMKLVGTDGNRYYSWELTPGTYNIGRKAECDFYIPNKTISRQHAVMEIRPGGEEILITDNNSHNGTSVNAVKVESTTPLKRGDVICFGETEFKIVAANEETLASSNPTATRLSEVDLEKSVFLSIDEALKPLPAKMADIPDLFPTFSELARMLVLHEPKEVMLEKSLQLIARVIPAERLAVLVTSPDQQEVFTAATLIPGGSDQGSLTLSKTIIDDILKQKQAILIGDSTHDARYAQQESIIMSKMKSAIAVPIFDEGEVHGILYADTSNPLHMYSDDQLRLLATFGNIIASRLQNYVLAEQREEKKIIDAELKRASSIQQRLLVSDMPELSDYSLFAYQDQCRSVGGDLYDVAHLPDGRLIFLVADVSGKGMGAALLMANILASFRILFGVQDFDLAHAVAQVNRQLHSFSNPGDFATLFVGLIDLKAHRLHYINAGHNPPVLINSEGKLTLLGPSGFMIGAFDEGVWQEQSVAFGPSDLLTVFTDGVTEAEGPTEQYGEERLERFLTRMATKSPDQIAKSLVEEIEEFTSDTPQSDDITMLLVKRTN